MSKGTYLLFLKVEKDTVVKSKSKEWYIEAGLYVYVGSALNNLEKRIERHLRKEKKKHWHIDFLVEKAQVIKVLKIISEERLEERISKYFCQLYQVVSKFGSTDLKTCGNLFKIEDLDFVEESLRDLLREFNIDKAEQIGGI